MEVLAKDNKKGKLGAVNGQTWRSDASLLEWRVRAGMDGSDL